MKIRLLFFFSLATSFAFAQQNASYPKLTLTESSGKTVSSSTFTGKNIFIVYFPDCDHCQREGAAIGSHASAFQKYQVWFISTATHAENQNYAQHYKLDKLANFHFVRTEIRDVLSNFGGIPTPSVFIYGADKKLINAFKGETPIETILKSL